MPVPAAPRAAMLIGKNGTTSSSGQRGSDETIRIVPSLAQRLIGLRVGAGGGESFTRGLSVEP